MTGAVRVLWCDLRGRERGEVVRAVVAVSRGCAVGVDLEDAALSARHGALPASFLSAGEREAVEALTGPQREAGLLRLWTLKEAVAKATGRGLTAPLEALHVGVEDEPAVRSEPPWPAGQYAARLLATTPGLEAAVAVEGPWRGVRQQRSAV